MKFTVFLIFFFVFSASAQKPEYATALIPANLKENANAVIRFEQSDLNITSRSNYNLKTLRVVTILNELGYSQINAYEYRTVKSIEATIYDASGNEIKKFRRKDFRDSAASEGSMITDNRVTYLNFTPTQYPFTVVYQSETTDSNTAFLPPWYPVNSKFVSVQKSVVKISFPSDLGFKFREYNFGTIDIKKQETANSVAYTAENIAAIKDETYSPSFSKLVPYVLFGLEKFRLEGVDGDAKTWESFSSWQYNTLLKGTDEVSIETQKKVKALVQDETDPIKKAKIIYEYVQSRTRYVSIQLGIGGWKPMKANDVDRLGYGDCKALSNYTRTLLDVVGIPSYYAVIWGDTEKKSMEPDFVSTTGNHIILAVPVKEDFVWLECTSQSIPFGFLGDFTDDRLALLIKPTGGGLVRTHVYKTDDNTQYTKGKYTLTAAGNIFGNVEIKSKGIQYDNKSALQAKSNDDLDQFYKRYFSINNLKLDKIAVVNDKEKVEFTETILLKADRYANTENNRLMFAVNAYNQASQIPQRYRSRIQPLEISRGFADYDEITIVIPEGYSIDAKPNDMVLETKFGTYKTEFALIDPTHMIYKRTLIVNSGHFEPMEYENYRKFRETVAKADNAKMVLVKI